MPHPMHRAELGDILTAIREVEESLDRRADRVGGALMMTWGVIVALVAAFYQLVAWNPAPYVRALGPFLPWVWVAPVAVGYAAGVLVGVRHAARSRDPEDRRQALLDFLPALTSTVLAAGLVLVGREDLIAGALLVGLSASVLLRCRAARPSPRFLQVAWLAAGVSALAGVAFLVRPVPWAWWVTGVLLGGTLLVLGRMRMASA